MTDAHAPTRPDLLSTGRLAVFTTLGTAAGALPIPFLPAKLQRHLRGALIHDIATRHGLSLTADAREVLASASSAEAAAAKWVSGAVGYVTHRVLRRVGPLSLIAPAKAGLDMLSLGLLFERYLDTTRKGPAVRIHAAEARGIREAIDRSLMRAFHPKLTPSGAPALPSPAEDLRDDPTRFLDSLLLTGADLPGYLVRRLEGAFDAVVVENPGLVGG